MCGKQQGLGDDGGVALKKIHVQRTLCSGKEHQNTMFGAT